jgi:hypothetical protein
VTVSLESDLTSSQGVDKPGSRVVEEVAKEVWEADEIPDGIGRLSTGDEELRVVDGGRTSASSKEE